MKTMMSSSVVVMVCLLQLPAGGGPTEPAEAKKDAKKDATNKPVEDSINIHMSYLFAPSYRRLKAVMRSEPADSTDWDTMRSEALLLAESGGNLTQRRSSNGFNPQAEKNWPKNSAAVKQHAAALYRAAKDKDFAAAKRSYLSMTESCNACHKSEVSLGSPPMLTPLGKGLTDY